MAEVLRTPPERFADLPGFPCSAHSRDDLTGFAGLAMSYLDEGPAAAPVFLCLHGEPTWSYLYRRMIPHFLATGSRVVAPDFFGFGRSDKPADDAAYTFDFHRNSLLSLVRALDLTDITLVVQDWGGLLGLTLPLDMPERFSRLIVMNTALPTGDAPLTKGFLEWRAYVARNPDLAVGKLMTRTCPHLSPAEAAAYEAPFPEARYKAGVRRFPQLVPEFPDSPGAAIGRAARAFWRNDWRGRSVMAIGMTDPVLGAPAMRALHRDIRGCPPPLEFPQAGHFVQNGAMRSRRPRSRRCGISHSPGAAREMRMPKVIYQKDERIGRITLNRPEVMNAIDDDLPVELADCVERANADAGVHVIVLSGAGEAFCAGYDLAYYAQGSGGKGVIQDMPWDPMKDYAFMMRNTELFMSLWRSYRPVICKVHGYAVAGGSDIALCADMIVMSTDAQIGYMPTRVWGCPTTAMWVYRLGPERAKRMLFTGDKITGAEAEKLGLVLKAVPPERLDADVEALAERMASVPVNQLMMQKLVVNQAIEAMGLKTTQLIATVFDGITRHSPEGVNFKRRAEAVGWKQAVRDRDDGTWDWTENRPMGGSG